jgi:acetyl-CoA C-acetyltransferase
MRKVAIICGVRTPFVKSMTSYKETANQELVTAALRALVEKFNLQGKILGDVALGAVMKNAEDWNLSREAVLSSGLHPHTPAYDVQRACGTGLETISQIALKIAAGQIEVGIGGGVDTNSDIQAVLPHELTWNLLRLQSAKSVVDKFRSLLNFKPRHLIPQFPAVMEPRTRLSMGQHTELMVKEWKVSRAEQDQLAFESHQKAATAYSSGFYSDLLTPFKSVTQDSLVRADTSLEKLARLSPAFDKSQSGTLTAGNSTALTDGASVVLLASEDYARKNNLPILAIFHDFQSSAVDFVKGEGLLIAPTIAVSELLKRNKLSLQDFDFYEIHEAFAGQVLVTLKAWESADYNQRVLGRETPMGSIDRNQLNVKGGSLALGHPFAATGGRIVASLSKILHEQKKGRGLISICTAGGMGVAAILEANPSR